MGCSYTNTKYEPDEKSENNSIKNNKSDKEDNNSGEQKELEVLKDSSSVINSDSAQV